MKVIARIYTPYKEKFGIPRQSGIADSIESKIVFEPEYRRSEALTGIEGYSHLWIIWNIWNFSEAEREEFSPTVRPPRLGGNKRVGVFATRSPFRPNPIGLSSVKLVSVEKTSMLVQLQCLCVQICSYKGTSQIGLGPTLTALVFTFLKVLTLNIFTF